jgi:hypothetical protein
MSHKETQLLAEAYLSIRKKRTDVPSDSETVSPEPNGVVSAGPMDEPAPGVDMDMVDSEGEEVNPEDNDTTGIPVEMSATGGMMEDPRMSEEDENEEDEMAITNLHSIRESIMKVAAFVATGGHLEPWQQQKLAIAMDNLAEVARRVH